MGPMRRVEQQLFVMVMVVRTMVILMASGSLVVAAQVQMINNDNIDEISFQVAPRVSYVIEPFDNADVITQITGSDPDLTVISTSPLFGAGALQVDLSNHTTVNNNNNILEQQQQQRTKVFGLEPSEDGSVRYSCRGANRVSFWYQIMVAPPNNNNNNNATTTTTTEEGQADPVTLFQDEAFTPQSQVLLASVETISVKLSFYSDDDKQTVLEAVLDTAAPGEWKEVAFAVNNNNDNDNASTVSLSEFHKWEIAVDASSTTTSSVSALLLDHLSCAGDGTMFGSLIELSETTGITFFESAISENETVITNTRSNNNSNLMSNDNRSSAVFLDMDYAIEQREVWGGFVTVSFSAPANAYYNLSNAQTLSMDYNIIEAASPKDRVHLRVELSDASDCSVRCNFFQNTEVYYSFHQILDDDATTRDNNGEETALIPLRGDNQAGSPLERTGWTGIVGNNVFDKEHVKGIAFEISINDKGDIGSLARGHIAVGNLQVGSTTSREDLLRTMVLDQRVTFTPPSQDGGPNYKRVQFAGAQCEALCAADDTCLYTYFKEGVDCYLYTSLRPENVRLTNNAFIDEYSFWKSNEAARGDFCDRCDCFESSSLIDCRGKDLLSVPQSVSVPWQPTIMDLRNNSALVFLGEDALNSTALSQLKEIRLPGNIKYMAESNLAGKNALEVVSIEDTDQQQQFSSPIQRNFIKGTDERFSNICCSPAEYSPIENPTTGLSFCQMGTDRLGSDIEYLPFINFDTGLRLVTLKESSEFMSEAASSPEACGEFCSLSSECIYFTHDARLSEAENSCVLLLNNGTELPSLVCCDVGDFADAEQKIPGFTSGLPPRTRHSIENAKVVVASSTLQLDQSSDYATTISYSLGSKPQRGAVWIEPYLPHHASGDLPISFTPPRVVLYDNVTTVDIEVRMMDVVQFPESGTLLIQNNVQSCDKAFSGSEFDQRQIDVLIGFTLPETKDRTNVIIIAAVTALLLATIAFFVFDRRRRRHDDLWIVKRTEIEFCDPPQIIGRGTFGLVILANYRGTQVAVKRVIPPQTTKKMNGTEESTTSDDFTSSHDPEHGEAPLPQQSMTPSKKRAQKGRYAQLKSEFIVEMRLLSKLRHPCITTVMGAVVESDEPMLVMEYMDHGSLFDVLHNETMVLAGDILLPILRDIAQGMRFLHAASPQVIHGDLKAQNILVDNRFRAKVADFGLSQKNQLGATGTPYWMAPELLRQEVVKNATTDVYAFGMILYEIFSRKEPYEGENPKEVLAQVADPLVNKRPAAPPGCPVRAIRMMEVCLNAESSYRPSFEVIHEELKTMDAEIMQPTNSPRSIGSRSGSRGNLDGNDLLEELFPRHVADALRAGRKVKPESKDCVSIMFSDLKGFTAISAKLSAIKVSEMLDRLYADLDALSREHNVFKVETIGDAYMAVTNLVEEQNDHAKRMVEFASQAVQVARHTLIDTESPEMGYLSMRIGIHSGPVVANVVGSRNPRYCLFGDSVNTASRMESTGEADRIHCSLETANLLLDQCPHIPTIPRGPVEVKGKGLMNTFWINETPTRPRVPVAERDPSCPKEGESPRCKESKSHFFL